MRFRLRREHRQKPIVDPQPINTDQYLRSSAVPRFPLITVPVRVIGNDVVGIRGRDLVKVAAYVISLLRLIDRRFQQVLVEHPVVAAVPFYSLVW